MYKTMIDKYLDENKKGFKVDHNCGDYLSCNINELCRLATPEEIDKVTKPIKTGKGILEAAEVNRNVYYEVSNQDQYNAWQTIQRSHSVANGVPVVSVNRVGFEQNGAMKFWGGSFATNAQGKLLYLASHDQEETKVVELDLNQSDYMRKHWPFLRDRRIDSYQPITKRFIDEE